MGNMRPSTQWNSAEAHQYYLIILEMYRTEENGHVIYFMTVDRMTYGTVVQSLLVISIYRDIFV